VLPRSPERKLTHIGIPPTEKECKKLLYNKLQQRWFRNNNIIDEIRKPEEKEYRMLKYSVKTAVKDHLEDMETKNLHEDTFSAKYMKYDSLYNSLEIKNKKMVAKTKNN
jgi:hypothetical protein